MTHDDSNVQEETHDVDAIPFHCTECNADVQLKEFLIDKAEAVGIGCRCEIISIHDFQEDTIPDKWTKAAEQ